MFIIVKNLLLIFILPDFSIQKSPSVEIEFSQYFGKYNTKKLNAWISEISFLINLWNIVAVY